MALGAPHRDRHVVAHHLRAHHGHGLALGRVDLARHDARTGLVGGEQELTDARTWTRTHHPNVVRDFVEGDGELFEGAVAFDNRVVRREGFKLVLGRDKRVSRRGGDVLGHQDVVALGGVDACANGRATQSELLEVRQSVAQGL